MEEGAGMGVETGGGGVGAVGGGEWGGYSVTLNLLKLHTKKDFFK